MGTPALPLAAASQRLRGRPGRLRKVLQTELGRQPEQRLRGQSADAGSQRPPPPRPARDGRVPRRLRVDGAGLDAASVLRRVRIPLPRGGELRKLLFDRTDLDRLIEVWKDRGM